jgi:hypothetical protein
MTKSTERRIAGGFVLAAIAVSLAFFVYGDPLEKNQIASADEPSVLSPAVLAKDLSPPDAATRFAEILQIQDSQQQHKEMKALMPELIENEHFLAVLDVLEPEFQPAPHTTALRQIIAQWTHRDTDSVLAYLAQPNHTSSYLATAAESMLLELRTTKNTKMLATAKATLAALVKDRPDTELGKVLQSLPPDSIDTNSGE